MNPGTILDAARSDNSFYFYFSAVVVAACLIVLGVHYKYSYNAIAGPFSLSPSLALDPGQREFVRAEGELSDTGVVEESVTTRFRVVETNREETAQFVTLLLDGRPFLVKIPSDFVGGAIVGELTPLTHKLRSLVPADPAPYPWILDATQSSYRIPSIPVALAVLLLVPSLLWLRSSRRRYKDVEKHAELIKLAKRGPLREMLDGIESDMRAAGSAARVGEFWITSSWIVKLSLLEVWPAEDVIGIGVETQKTKTSEPPKYELLIWRRGESSVSSHRVEGAIAQSILLRVAECAPWAVVDDVAAFRVDWDTSRTSLEEAADARRKTLE